MKMTRSKILKSNPYKNTTLSSIVIHALATGKGITWLDRVRIPYKSDQDKQQTQFRPIATNPQPMDWKKDLKQREWFGNMQGRFPANLLVSDDILNDGINHKSGGVGTTTNVFMFDNVNLQSKPTGNFYKDSGSYSRYFDLDKWWEKLLERIEHENSDL